MREATYISHVSRMRAGPEALKTLSKLRFAFVIFPPNYYFILFGSPWRYGFMVPQWGHGAKGT